MPSSLGTLSRLYVGSLAAAESPEFIKTKGISHVLTAAGRLQVDLPEPRPSHLCIDLADHPTANLFEFLEDALSFCDGALGLRESSREKEGSLLVHCASGVSRSVSICMAFLMTRAGLTYEESIALIRTNRPWASPNLGFQKQLQLIEEKGGDIPKAKESWLATNSTNILEEARMQREMANIVHAELDELENEIATSLSADAVDAQKRKELLRRLEALQDRVDTCQGESGDRVAKTILKAAAQKASRLVNHLSDNSEEQVPEYCCW